MMITTLLAAATLAPQSLTVGKPAPSVSFQTMDGKTLFLKDLQNRGPFFLYFIRDGDAVNGMAAPYLHRIFRSYVPGRAAWYGIFSGKRDRATSWQAEFKPPYQVLMDPNGEAVQVMKIESSPSIVFIDAEGNVQREWRGYSGYWLKDLNAWMARVNNTKPKKLDFSRTPSVTQYGASYIGKADNP